MFQQYEIQKGQVLSDIINQIYFPISMFLPTPDAQTAAAEWLRGIKWKVILFSICWTNIYQFNEPFFGNISLFQARSFGDALTSSRMNEF